MKVALCCIGRFENRYALEFIEKFTKEKKQYLKNNNINIPNINDCKNFIIKWD